MIGKLLIFRFIIIFMNLDDVKRMREIGEEYDKLLDLVLNTIFTKVPQCMALELTDSLSPIFSTTQVKSKALLAFPYKCDNKIGYIVITEDGKLIFEDEEGNIKEIGDINT